MISTSRNFLFIHVAKTGGNALQGILSKYSDDRIATKPGQDGLNRFNVKHPEFVNLNKHSSMRDYSRIVHPDLFGRLLKFAVVRNPWDRMISYYFSPHRGERTWSRTKFIRMVRMCPPWRTSVVVPTWPRRLRRLMGQPVTLDVDLDFVIRFENLENDFHEVCRRIGIPEEPLPKRNQSVRSSSYTEYYDDELVDIVAKQFREEIDYFGYRFGEDR